jgi:SAM-dependent MidA family methyltransferase
MGTTKSSAVDAIRARIVAEGPVPFEVFQHAALYGEGGFFAKGPVRSSATGDFLTSPEVSPWFGKTIAQFLATHRVETLVEAGAGSGSLLRPLLAELGDVDAWAVEASPTARASLADVAPTDHVVESLDAVPDGIKGAIVANELVDNLPVAVAVRTEDGWYEHYVGTVGDELAFVAVTARPEVAAWADAYGGEVPVGGVVEVQLEAAWWLEQAVAKLSAGVILLIDYGGTAEELEPRRNLGTLRTYRGHHLGPDPLLEPGETDITVDVNFTALRAVAESRGRSAELHRQDDFLREWGLRDVISQMRHEELAHARAGDTMQQLSVKSERLDAETLLHPRGLGDFRVLIVEV